MTAAGDVGSGTTGGTAPMVKVGAEPMKREYPNKKQCEKDKKDKKTFKEYINSNKGE